MTFWSPPQASARLSAASAGLGGYNLAQTSQYHIQTDEGPERYFRYQTDSGQYRKEKRLEVSQENIRTLPPLALYKFSLTLQSLQKDKVLVSDTNELL